MLNVHSRQTLSILTLIQTPQLPPLFYKPFSTAVLYKLGFCIPSYSSPAVTKPDNGLMITSDTSGAISLNTYATVACTGTPSTSVLPKAACACNYAIGKTCQASPDPTVGKIHACSYNTHTDTHQMAIHTCTLNANNTHLTVQILQIFSPSNSHRYMHPRR